MAYVAGIEQFGATRTVALAADGKVLGDQD